MQCAGSGVKGSSAKPCSNCDGEGYYTIRLDPKFMPASFNIEELLADYFGVDLKEAEKEKRAILAELQRMNS
jgi:hypothetical protein